MSKLTLEDLDAAVNSERRLGSAGYSDRPSQIVVGRLGDRIVLREANAKGWTINHLIAWVDSKYGRWFWDSLYGCNDAEGAAKLVNLDWMDDYDRSLYEGI